MVRRLPMRSLMRLLMRVLMCSLVCGLVGCDGEDATDAGPGGVDAGPGGVDAGPGDTDAGPGGGDAGPGGGDAGPGGSDAGPGGTDGGGGGGAVPCSFPQTMTTPIRLLFACDIESSMCRLFAPETASGPRCGDTDVIDVALDRNQMTPSDNAMNTGGGWTIESVSPGTVAPGFNTRSFAIPDATDVTAVIVDDGGARHELVFRFDTTAETTTVISFRAL